MRVTARRSLAIGWVVVLLPAAALAATHDPRLVEAAKNRDTSSERALLQQGADVNTQVGGATALHWAAHWDDLETAGLLLRAGANVNVANDLGVTALALACTNGNAAMVEKLLAAGANPNAVQITGESPLMSCAHTGSVVAVKALLARGAGVNTKEKSRGQTALMWAVAAQHPEVVRALLEHGADVHARTLVSHQLVFTGNPSGAGRNPAETTKTIEKGGSTPLLFAARQGDLDSARLLVTAGANPNDTGPDGNSALVVASHSGHGKLAAFLLDKDANPNAAGAGYTALHAAVLRGDLDLVKALLSHGAKPDSPITMGTPVTREGQDFVLPTALVGATPFYLAAKFIETGILGVLAAAGANSHFTMKDGTTPLMAAAGLGWGGGEDRRGAAGLDAVSLEDERRAFDAAKLLLNLGADVNAANQAGDTALHGAAAKGFNSVIQLFADNGARLEAKNKRGQTPLSMTAADARPGAALGQNPLKSTADLLRRLGAKE